LAERLAANSQSRKAESERSEPKYNCPDCQDTGVVPVVDGETVGWNDERLVGAVFTVRHCKCVQERRIEALFGSSHITESFRQAGFKNFVVDGRPQCVRVARDKAVDYYKRFDEIRHTRNNSILLMGAPGSGKTHLLMAIANGLLRRGITVQYFPWVEGVGELRENRDDIEDRLNAMKTVEVLFIDDLYKGRRQPTDFQLEALFNVVNYRYQNNLPMLVSTEKDVDTLFDIDEGIARRIYEMAKGHRVLMGLTPEEEAAGMVLNYSLVEQEGA
jgi:DNA replication protein DnaC